MIQNLINVVALLSGLTSLGMIGGAGYLYMQKDFLIQEGINQLSAGAIDAISDAVPDILDSSIPDYTGMDEQIPATPAPVVSGPAIPVPMP